MSAGINEWHGVGNMTADPELKKSDGTGSDRCTFSLAINRPGQDSEATFLDIICWDKLANQVNDFGRKGRQVYVRGEVEVRRWEDEDGGRRKAYRIKAYTVRFLDRKPQDEEETAEKRSSPAASSSDYDDLPF